MPSDDRVLTTADLIGQPAYDLSGEYVGRVADVTVARDGDGRWRLREVVVTARLWGRLLGYERAGQAGPWLLVVLARGVVRRQVRRLPGGAVGVGGPTGARGWPSLAVAGRALW